MKHPAAVLLVCLLLAGTVSAVSLNPGSVGAAKVAVTTTTPHIILNPSAFKASVVVTETGRGMLEVYSVPSGATVTLDGNTNSGGLTPAKYSLLTGSHTVTISLTGYQTYTETFNLDPGAVKDINADLKKIPVNAGLALVPDTKAVIKPGDAVTIVTMPGSVTRTPVSPTPTTPFVPTTPVTQVCPNADWSCLTDDEAAQQFGYPNARYGDEPCGYTPVNSQMILKYCYMDVDSGGSLPSGALVAGGIREGDDIYILNQTLIEHAIVNKSPAVRKTGDAGTNPVQSFFDFLSGIVGGSAKPESRLDIVGFAPQPEPPKVASGG